MNVILARINRMFLYLFIHSLSTIPISSMTSDVVGSATVSSLTVLVFGFGGAAVFLAGFLGAFGGIM